MNKHIKKAIERFLQPTIEEMVGSQVEHKIAYMGDEIEKMAEDSVESAIGSARIDRMIEEEVQDKMRDYNFEDDIRNAAEDFDYDKVVGYYLKDSDTVAEFIATTVREVIKNLVLVTEYGVQVKLVIKEKTDEEAKTAD